MDQFVAAFHRFCDAQTVFISTLNPRSVGLETAFSIDLADHTPALRGVGVVLQSWATPQNPYGRPGLQLGVRRLTSDSEPVFDRLLFAREATAATPTGTAKMMPVIVVKPGVKRPLANTQQMPFGALKPTSTPPPEPTPEAKTDVSPDPAIASPLADGERTPGSDLVLPANPLMNISDHSLEGFVDCTLYEETGNFFGEQPVIEDPADPVAAPPLLAPRRATTTPPQAAVIISRPPDEAVIPSIPSLVKAPVAQAIGTKPLPIINKLTPPMGATADMQVEFTQRATANRAVPLHTLELAKDIAERMTPPPIDPGPPGPPGPPAQQGPPPIPGKPWVSPETAELLDIEPDPPSVAQPFPMAPHHTEYPAYNAATHASGSYDAVAAPPPYTPPSQTFPVTPYRAPNDHRRWVIGATAAVTLLIAIALLTAGHSKPATKNAAATPPPAPKLLAANTEHARLAPIPDKPVVDATSTEPEPAADETSGVVGRGPCKVAVSTTPAGSMISFDGEQLGPSPLTVAGPCTRRRIDIAHPRYAPAQRFITPKAEDAVDVTLMRPTHNLFIESQPAGAIVSIDGHRAGTTPTMVKVMGFTTVDIAISKPGWKATTKKLYSKTAADRLSIKLGR
jgi:hypothetical protein